MELTDGSETSVISIVTPGNYPKENILHTEHGESLKSRNYILVKYKRLEWYSCSNNMKQICILHEIKDSLNTR